MGFHGHIYPRPLIPNSSDPSAVDFRAFYPYTPNEVKHRKRTTTQQLKVLEAVFKRDTKPNAQLRQELASELNMTARGVQVWFQNRRAKEKAKAGRVSLASKPTSAADELKEEEADDDALQCIVKTEAVPTDLLLRDSDESNQLNASPSPPSTSDIYPPSHAPSPPELRVITDSAVFNWTSNDPNDLPPDSATSCTSAGFPTISTCTALPNYRLESCLDLDSSDLHSLRRGSLPVTSALYHSQISQHIHPLDPLVRRCSVDASLQRLALHPYASLARAKNSAFYGAGVGVASNDSPSLDVSLPSADGSTHYHLMNNRHSGTHRLQRRFVSSSALSAAAQYGSSLSNMRRLSMDSRASRVSSLQRIHHSPSPSSLSTYGATCRTSLPESHLYSIAARPVGSPIPGPLPMPGFQFGAASSSTPSIASPSSNDSERNSPDSIKSFPFGRDEENQPSPPYDTYNSRFGSVASIATSESSLNSVYFGGLTVEHDRRNSTCTAQYYTPPSVGRPEIHDFGPGDETRIPSTIVVGYSPPEEYGAYDGSDRLPLSIPDMRRLQQTPSEPLGQHQTYVSPVTSGIGTASEVQSPHGQDSPSVTISTTSELAFALESKPPELKPINGVTQSSTPEAYVGFGAGEQIKHYHAHQQSVYYPPEVDTYQHERPTYPSAYPFTDDVQAPQQQPSDFGIYSATDDYSDPLMAPPVSGDNLQAAESFVAYS